MRVLPILFNTEMVRAILEGRKTVTRRLVKKSQCILPDKEEPSELKKEDLFARLDDMAYRALINCTYKSSFKQGDILYVRETWCNANREGVEPEYYYYADTPICEDYDSKEWKWRPSIHMPKEAARIWLKVTDVRVERLQDMNGQDILREGVNCHVHQEADYFDGNQKMMFEELWNSTIKKTDLERYGWDVNPMVWVIEFERCAKPTTSVN